MPEQQIPNQLPADNKQKLRKEIEAAFNLDELKTLSIDLEIEFENLGVDTREGVARELIERMERTNRTADLIEELKKARPDSNWEELLVIDPDALAKPIELPPDFVDYIDQRQVAEFSQSSNQIQGEITNYFQLVDDRVNIKYKFGFLSPAQNNAKVKFESEKLVSSLLKLNMTLTVALQILAETVMTLDAILITQRVDIANELKTSHIRDAVVQSIYRLSNIYGRNQVQMWGDRYARRFGGSYRQIQVIHTDGEVEELSYSFIKNALLPDIFQKLFHLDFDKFRTDILSAEHISAMAKSVVEYVRAIDLYHIRYDFLVDLITEIGIQPPHPWFAPENIADMVIDYDLDRIQYHKLKADFFIARNDSGSIIHHCKELVHHSSSALLSNYGCYLGSFNLASLRILIGMIEYHASSRYDEDEGFFKFKQFFGDLISTHDIDHERFVQKLKQVDRMLHHEEIEQERGIEYVVDTCVQLSEEITALITHRKAIVSTIKSYDVKIKTRQQLLQLAKDVLVRVPGIRFAPRQDDIKKNILWAYHDLTTPVFQKVSPKFAVSVLHETDEVMLSVTIDEVLSYLSKEQSLNQAQRTVIFVTHFSDTVQKVIANYLKNYELQLNCFVLNLNDLIAISENKNRLQTLSDLLLEQ